MLMVVLYDLRALVSSRADKAVIALLRRCRTRFAGKKSLDAPLNFFLRLIRKFYSTSDFWHPVATPVLLFAGESLASAKFENFADLAKGIFFCQTFLDFVAESKKFLPEIIRFLENFFQLFVAPPDPDSSPNFRPTPPDPDSSNLRSMRDRRKIFFKSIAKSGFGSGLLSGFGSEILSGASDESPDVGNSSKISLKFVFSEQPIATGSGNNPEVELPSTAAGSGNLPHASLLFAGLKLVSACVELWKELPSFAAIFDSLLL